MDWTEQHLSRRKLQAVDEANDTAVPPQVQAAGTYTNRQMLALFQCFLQQPVLDLCLYMRMKCVMTQMVKALQAHVHDATCFLPDTMIMSLVSLHHCAWHSWTIV